MEHKAQGEIQSSGVWGGRGVGRGRGRGRGRQVTDANNNGIMGARNRLSFYAEENLRESMSQLTLQAQGKLSGYGDEHCYPDRPGQPDCGHYMRTGFCGYGINCRFNHPIIATKQADQNKGELPQRIGHNECQFFLKTGTCKFGATCKYHHPHGRAGPGHTQLNMLGLPMRMGEKECTYYMHTGSCKYGASCKFDHPQPASLGTYVPVSGVTGSSIYSTVRSPLVASSGAQHSHSLSTWASSRAPHVQAPRIQGPPYIPVIYSSQQGMLSAAPVWGMYQGPTGPMASERQQLRGISMYSLAQPNHPSVGAAQGIFTPFLPGSTAIVHQPGQFMHIPNLGETYPERPGQPECQYYIKTGDCKFGSACRYHHPQGRLSDSFACILSPIGLPIRPTQPTCTYYNRYGICKFGPTCRFDHPMTGISYSPSSSSLSELPVVPYPRVSSPTTTLFQSSSSKTSHEIKNNRDEPLRESTGSKQDVGAVYSATTKRSPSSSHVSILSETA
ncbi:hypothetical protein KI387_016943 [Taxus chinensis]|uniref:C3H1-type domain-containing protein n=1 Tax=Taxus chinensis TaxID=29808 RepID=A0AA38GIA7_TAXCH|nr:hypothetical protein KI387_016943 [Taxus chinensis]